MRKLDVSNFRNNRPFDRNPDRDRTVCAVNGTRAPFTRNSSVRDDSPGGTTKWNDRRSCAAAARREPTHRPPGSRRRRPRSHPGHRRRRRPQQPRPQQPPPTHRRRQQLPDRLPNLTQPAVGIPMIRHRTLPTRHPAPTRRTRSCNAHRMRTSPCWGSPRLTDTSMAGSAGPAGKDVWHGVSIEEAQELPSGVPAGRSSSGDRHGVADRDRGREIGVGEQLLGRWVAIERARLDDPPEALDTDERAEL